MRRSLVLAALLAAVVLGGCGGGGVRVAAGAADQAAVAIGGVGGQVVELSADDVARMARVGAVSEDAIRAAAGQADEQPQWARWMASARQVAARTDNEVRDVALGSACDALNGEITTEQELYESLAGQLEGLTQSELESVYTATLDLYGNLAEAVQSGDPARRVSALIACYTLQQVS
jgi:hypothetical protein